MPRKSKQFPMIDMEKTGKRLQELIEEHGYTVKEIQTILIIASHQAIYSWFAGNTMPSIDNFVALSKLLEVSLDDMIICIEHSEKRIERFKIQEYTPAYYDALFIIQDFCEHHKEPLEIEHIMELAKQTNLGMENVLEIINEHCILVV